MPELFQRLTSKYVGDTQGVSTYCAGDAKEEVDNGFGWIYEMSKGF